MNRKFAEQSFWDAIGADDLVASEILESPLEYDEAFPFDRIESHHSLDAVLWTKTFEQGFTYDAPYPLVRSYLGTVMPELLELTPSPLRPIAVWKTADPRMVMGDVFDSMSPSIKLLLEGSTTFQELIDEFFTPEINEKARALWDASVRYRHDEILRILMNGESLSLSEGML